MTEFYTIINLMITLISVILVGSTVGFIMGNLLWTVYSTIKELRRLLPEELRKWGYWK